MARITNLTAWGEILQGKNDFTFRILMKDPYIKDQNGVFQFQCLNVKSFFPCKISPQAVRFVILAMIFGTFLLCIKSLPVEFPLNKFPSVI